MNNQIQDLDDTVVYRAGDTECIALQLKYTQALLKKSDQDSSGPRYKFTFEVGQHHPKMLYIFLVAAGACQQVCMHFEETSAM